MLSKLEKLISSTGPSLNDDSAALSKRLCKLAGPLADDLAQMLRERNGFYALEGALHVFPSCYNQREVGLDEWNDDALWRAEYQGMADGCLFFAEDIFGGQFCIKDGKVFTFDPETGAIEYLADDIEGWAAAIVGDYEVLTGYPLAHQWQEQNGPLPANKRLLPKVPFVAGGEFELGNLYLADAVEGMKFRAYIANQIKNLPDGAQIRFDVVD
mgnify:CR=1 FL=1